MVEFISEYGIRNATKGSRPLHTISGSMKTMKTSVLSTNPQSTLALVVHDNGVIESCVVPETIYETRWRVESP